MATSPKTVDFAQMSALLNMKTNFSYDLIMDALNRYDDKDHLNELLSYMLLSGKYRENLPEYLKLVDEVLEKGADINCIPKYCDVVKCTLVVFSSHNNETRTLIQCMLFSVKTSTAEQGKRIERIIEYMLNKDADIHKRTTTKETTLDIMLKHRINSHINKFGNKEITKLILRKYMSDTMISDVIS